MLTEKFADCRPPPTPGTAHHNAGRMMKYVRRNARNEKNRIN